MLRGLWARAMDTWSRAGAYALLPAIAGALHLLEVHLVDARAADAMRSATGADFAWFGGLDVALGERATAAVTAYYLLAFLAFLAWTPGLLAAAGDVRLLKRTLLCYPILYLLALPGFLAFPSVNPYVRDGSPSPFDAVWPGLDETYYLLTTPDNTFPSLHVAFTLVLAAALWRAWPSWRVSTATHAILLTLSVVLVRVHYVEDAIAGAILAWIAWRLAGSAAEGAIGRWLDARSLALAARVRALADAR